MALEDLTGPGKFIDALVPGNPVSNDDRREGDDHIRGIKNVLRNTFPNVNGAVTASDEQIDAAVAISGGVFPGDVHVAFDLVVDGRVRVGLGVPSYAGVPLLVHTALGRNFGVRDLGGMATALGYDDGGGAVALRLAGAPLKLSGNGGAADHVAVTAAGDVGIGTAAPGAALQVDRADDARLVLNGSGAGVASGGTALFYRTGAFVGSIGVSANRIGDGSADLLLHAAGNLRWNVGAGFGSEALRIDAAGNATFTAPGGVRVDATGGGAGAGGLTISNPTAGATHLTIAGDGGAKFVRVKGNSLDVLDSGAAAVLLKIENSGRLTQKDGLTLASDPGPAAGAVPIGGVVLAGAPGGTNLNGLATINAATTPLTLFATGSGANGTVNAGTFRNCGALSSASTVALWVRTA